MHAMLALKEILKTQDSTHAEISFSAVLQDNNSYPVG